MNPSSLFSLSANQRSRYLCQPDELNDYYWYDHAEEYEHPPYLEKETLRFWYNTQSYGFPVHWHNAQELILPLENGYTVTCQSQVYSLEPGDILLIPPGELHSLDAPPSGSRFIFLYELEPLGRISDFSLTRSFLTSPVLINQAVCPSLYKVQIDLILRCAEYYWSDSPARQMLLYSALLEFYARYTEYCSRNLSSSDTLGSMPPENTRKLSALLSHMETHYAQKLSLEDAARLTGLSKFYLTRLFRQHTGQTFHDYLNMLRIRASEDLLRDASVSVSQAAAACGFSSLSSFHRAFRSVKGCTPSQFRRLFRNSLQPEADRDR